MNIIYTDGSCSPNPGEGGWGLVCYVGGFVLEDCGYSHHTTNNEMEMMAFFTSLSFLHPTLPNIIYSDSRYVINEIINNKHTHITNGKITGWLENQITNKRQIKNLELWMKIYNKIKNEQLTFELRWVKGHNTSEGNNRADWLANQGRLQNFDLIE